MERERDYSELQPPELNEEFHKLFGLVSAIQISLDGSVMGEDSIEMSDEERAFYYGILGRFKQHPGIFGNNPYEGMTIEEIDASLKEDIRETFMAQAKGAAARERRMTFGATLMVKLEELMPFVQGTDSFKEYIHREMRRCIRDGTDEGGKGHWFYGDDKFGGMFHPVAVEGIEERSFQIFSHDIEWYGIDPMMIMGRIVEADYDNDPIYRSMVDLGRKWKQEFIERYKRSPMDIRGQEIQIS